MSISSVLDAASNPLLANYHQCREFTRHYAKSFYFSSFLLPKEKRRAAYAVYTFCRYADNIVDARKDITNEIIQEKFGKLHEFLNAVYSNQSFINNTDCAFADAVRTYKIPKQYFIDLVDGVCMDITTKRYETYQELDVYCYKVASVVGLIMSEMFGYSNAAALTNAIALGKAMQLTNILRDIKEDYKMNRVYLPKEELDCFNYTEDDIKNNVVNDNFKALMKYQMERAREYYNIAKNGLPYLTDDGSRTTAVIMLKTYSGILNKIEESGYDIYSQRHFVSLPSKVVMTSKYFLSRRERKHFSVLPKNPIIEYIRPQFQTVDV